MLPVSPHVLLSTVHFLGLALIFLTFSHLGQIICTRNICISSHDHLSDSTQSNPPFPQFVQSQDEITSSRLQVITLTALGLSYTSKHVPKILPPKSLLLSLTGVLEVFGETLNSTHKICCVLDSLPSIRRFISVTNYSSTVEKGFRTLQTMRRKSHSPRLEEEMFSFDLSPPTPIRGTGRQKVLNKPSILLFVQKFDLFIWLLLI